MEIFGGQSAAVQKMALATQTEQPFEMAHNIRDSTAAGLTVRPSLRRTTAGDDHAERRVKRKLEMEKEPNMIEAEKFTSEYPFVILEMKKSHVVHGFYLSIGAKFGRRDLLPKQTRPVVLTDSTGTEWAAKWLARQGNPGISGGWRRFALDHQLKEKDVCILELVCDDEERFEFRVHIYRRSQDTGMEQLEE